MELVYTVHQRLTSDWKVCTLHTSALHVLITCGNICSLNLNCTEILGGGDSSSRLGEGEVAVSKHGNFKNSYKQEGAEVLASGWSLVRASLSVHKPIVQRRKGSVQLRAKACRSF